MLDDRARAAAFGARLREAERTLVAVDDTGAVAVGTHLRAGARTRATAVAVGAGCRAGQAQRHGHALGRFEEAQLGFGFQVVAAARTAGARLLRAPAEQAAEQVTDVGTAGLPRLVEQVAQVELCGVAAETTEAASAAAEPAAESTAGEKPPGFVVFGTLGVVGQNFLGLGRRFVAFLGRRVVRIAVRMVVGQHLARGALDLILGGVRGDAEFLVEVLLDPFTLSHVASPPQRRSVTRLILISVRSQRRY